MLSPKEILDGIVQELEKNPSVITFTLVGSQARDDVYKATEHSDLEAYIIVKDEEAEDVEKSLPEIVAKFGEVLFSFKHAIGFVTTYENLFRIELPVVKQSDMKSIFSRPKAQVVKVLIDRTDGELQKILDQRPDIIDFAKDFADKVTNFWYWQILAAQYFKKGEIYNTRAVLNIHASALIKLFELLNDQNILLLETNKRIEQFLTEDQVAALKEVTPAYDEDQIKQALNRIMEIFPEVFKQIKENYGYSYDETLEGKIKPRVLKLL